MIARQAKHDNNHNFNKNYDTCFCQSLKDICSIKFYYSQEGKNRRSKRPDIQFG